MSRHAYPNAGAGGKRRSPLDDPERVRKDLENERRIARIQQVREKSNNLARKIRQDVAEEKERQLQKLAHIQQQELNTWRESVLVKKHQDYRSAVFQVGAAHRAAQTENEVLERQRQQRAENIRKCGRQAVKRVCKQARANVQLRRSAGGKDLNVEGRATACTQTPVPVAEDKENKRMSPAKMCNKSSCKIPSSAGKRKRRTCRREDVQCLCESSMDESLSVSSGSLLNLDDSDEDDEDNEAPVSAKTKQQLQQTPAIILDVEVQSDDSMVNRVGGGTDMNDMFVQSNRNFCNVLCPSPACSPERRQMGPECFGRRQRFTQISDLVQRNGLDKCQEILLPAPRSPAKSLPCSPKKTVPAAERPMSPTKVAKSPTKSIKSPSKQEPKKSPTKSTAKPKKKQPAKSTAPPAAKVIDAGLKRNVSAKTKSMPLPAVAPTPVPSLAKGVEQHTQTAPESCASQPPMPAAAQDNLSSVGLTSTTATAARSAQGTKSSVSTTTTFVMRHAHGSGPGSNVTRVQFYDYKNKYKRQYEPASETVHTNAQDDTQLSAMDHARIENQLTELRQLELDKLRKLSDERGQKALEREQVRRDCAELTEKLDALAQQHPQLLPSDANFIPSHRFADRAARREVKLNEAMEKMLLRPAIITCPEVGTSTKSATVQKTPRVAVNVGAPSERCEDGATASSESCCSILLDYVNGQSKQLRTELNAADSNTAKSEKLNNLLMRIEKIRTHLLAELRSGNNAVVTGDNVQQVIESIRRERADILDNKQRSLDARETDLQQKEALLEKKLREFYNEKQKATASGAPAAQSKEQDKPVEIVIKVKSDGTIKQCVPKYKVKTTATATSPILPADLEMQSKQPEQPPDNAQRQNSYDTNSTSYRSLPPVIYKGIQPLPQQQPPVAPLDPTVAHYVQRLLGMTRNCVQELSVSSSDVNTPGCSVVQNSRNLSQSSASTEIDDRRMQRVQDFISDNRSFIDELEDTLRNQSQNKSQQQQQHAEQSLRALDEIWKKRLKGCPTGKSNERRQAPTTSGRKKMPVAEPSTSTGRRSVSIAPEATSEKSTPHAATSKTLRPVTSTVTTRPMEGNRELRPVAATNSDASGQIERYAKLTENCTQRIAELTELITKVREEKQRLVEITLTSVSEGERHSTEYMELPNASETAARSHTVSERSDAPHNTSQSTSEALPSLSDQEPLQKHKPTGASRDSGICISRPLTAQGQLADAEPTSLASSTQSSTAATKRIRPPPPATIRRYSPHMAEEDVAHELSTIAEVDTPAQSHITGAVPFPTFEQYAQELQLDLSQLDADHSFRLEREFTELLHAIHQRSGAVNYREFPSIRAYLHNVTSTQVQLDSRQQVVQELVQQLRLANVSAREFPTRHEYVQQRLAQQPPEQRQLIDSASLEYLSDTPHNETSDSFNVEAELRKRRILKTGFRRGNGDVASSTRRNASDPLDPPNESGIEQLSTSPGNTLSSDFDREMQRLGIHWPTTMLQRQRQADALSSGSTPEPAERCRPSTSRRRAGQEKQPASSAANATLETSKLGRSLNLREFLTRELLKHHVDSSFESSDDSLKSNFLQSVIESLTPISDTPPTGFGHGTGATNERQKTSTPVVSFHSTQEPTSSTHSGNAGETGTKLFSGESVLSSVHYEEQQEQQQQQKSANNKKSPRMSPRTSGVRST